MDLQLDELGRPLLTQFSEDGFVDCVLRIENLVSDGSTHAFTLMASHDGEAVGLRVDVKRGMRGGFDNEMALIQGHVYRSAVQFHRIGPASDRLIRILAAQYGVEVPTSGMIERFAFTGILLHKDDVDADSMPVKIKLFGRDDSDDLEADYFESFFNLDLPRGLVFWNEKDGDYRLPLIRGLSRPLD